MSTLSPDLRKWLEELRQHPQFQVLMKSMKGPQLRRYRPSGQEPLDALGARLAYHSGRQDEFDAWVFVLTGEAPEQENLK